MPSEGLKAIFLIELSSFTYKATDAHDRIVRTYVKKMYDLKKITITFNQFLKNKHVEISCSLQLEFVNDGGHNVDVIVIL